MYERSIPPKLSVSITSSPGEITAVEIEVGCGTGVEVGVVRAQASTANSKTTAAETVLWFFVMGTPQGGDCMQAALTESCEVVNTL